MPSFGTITPSSNIVVEQVTIAMMRDIPDVSPHFSRFGYAGSQTQFTNDYDWQGMLGAAQMLADAKVGAICWNGSRGGTLGFELDRVLCDRISQATGIAACTSTLALDELLADAGIERISFVTPYIEPMNQKIAEIWSAAGYQVVDAIGAGLTDNFSYSTVSPAEIEDMARQAARGQTDALIFYCTNMRAAALCRPLEDELGIAMLDAVSAGVWKSLALIRQRAALLPHWGRLLR